MQKIFTNLVAASLMLGTVGATAQTQIWPTADTNTINASQFKGTGSIFTRTRVDSVVPANHTGWYTKGLASSVAAKADSAVWQWSTNGASRGAYRGATPRVIASPSAANGCALFDSDWLDNKGTAALAGTGQAPAINAGELVSPLIDARGSSNMTVQFNQLYRNFQAATYVSWSEDSGRTWKPRIQLNANITANAVTATNAVANVKLVGSVGTSGFRIKFIFEGNYYYWVVDDVKLIKISNELRVNPFFAIAPSYITQKNQVEDMNFLLDISNNGNAATNVKVTLEVVRIAGATTTSIHKDTLLYGSVRADTTIENKILPRKLLASALTLGQYYALYKVSSDSIDQLPANDTIGFGFMVSDSTYWKEGAPTVTTRPADGNWAAATDPHTWRAGNYYYVKTGTAHTLTTATAYVSGLLALKGQRISLGIYEWVDANNDKAIQSSERNIVAYADTLIPQTQTLDGTYLTFAMKDVSNQRWFYPGNNKQYLAMVEFDPPSTGLNMFVGYNKGLTDYGAFILMKDQMYLAGTGVRRYGPILGIKGDADWTTTGFGTDYVPTVRINLLPFIVNETVHLTADHKIAVYPNPATEKATLAVDFPHVMTAIAVHILDNTGRLLEEQVFTNVQKENLSLNIENLAAGTYMLRILTPDGVRTTKLIIVK
jgi:Secretion system C-terminal sorting domain